MKKVILSLLAIGLVLVFLTSCDVNPSKMSPQYAKEMASKITYTKDDRTGLCFAVVATRKTGKASQSGMGLTLVPCESVKQLIK